MGRCLPRPRPAVSYMWEACRSGREATPARVARAAAMISQAKKFQELAVALNNLANAPDALNESDFARVRAILARAKDALAAVEKEAS